MRTSLTLLTVAPSPVVATPAAASRDIVAAINADGLNPIECKG